MKLRVMANRKLATALAVFFLSTSFITPSYALETAENLSEPPETVVADELAALSAGSPVPALKKSFWATGADKAQEIVLQALSLLENPYRMGGKTPQAGFDCSGFVSHVFRQALGLNVSGNAAAMANMGHAVKFSDLKVGDLVFFNTLGRPLSHVGIYIGDYKFVHAANSRKGVRIDRLTDMYYAARYDGARSIFN